MPQFALIVKKGTEELAHIEGRPVKWRYITVDDIKRVVEVEQYLEKLFGLRFHINEVNNEQT